MFQIFNSFPPVIILRFPEVVDVQAIVEILPVCPSSSEHKYSPPGQRRTT